MMQRFLIPTWRFDLRSHIDGEVISPSERVNSGNLEFFVQLHTDIRASLLSGFRDAHLSSSVCRSEEATERLRILYETC